MSIGAGVCLLVFAVIFAVLVNSAKRRRGAGSRNGVGGGFEDFSSGWLAGSGSSDNTDSSHGQHQHHSGFSDGGHQGGCDGGSSAGSDGGAGGGGDGGGGGH